ncbi:MAG TPA: serine--tRNA ligase [Ktedonobacterales bacterium]|jgi:seryl-tRNA synthetase|nr:serine--tRNA ligase [Ktedonobacterales bacterium]
MLSERWLRAQPEQARAALRRRHAGAEALAALEEWLALDAERRTLAARFDAQAAEARQRGAARDPQQAEARDAAQATRHALDTLAARMQALALTLPNIPDPRTPDGADASANAVVRAWGEHPSFDFAPKPHDVLGARLGILDLPRATRMSGPRFPLLMGAGARLARALAAWMLDAHREAGYTEVAPPDLLLAETLVGTGHLPQHRHELFALPADDLYLSPTAEAQLMALHAGETLDAAALPLAYTSYTQAYRREAGSAGARTHGLLRQRQFGKVELAQVVAPEAADTTLTAMVASAEALLQRLDLPYRVVELCAGELPFSAQRTFDLEVWLAGEGRYIEISSVSDCGEFQARRLRLRYHARPGAPASYPHTLNGSALPIGRTLAALLERGQRADGSVALPAALASHYTGPMILQPASV